MSQAPDVYPDFPDEAEPGESGEPDESGESGVEGAALPGVDGRRTGDPRVDAVLDSLDGLEGRPVSEHAAVFERAHEALRSALEPQRESA